MKKRDSLRLDKVLRWGLLGVVTFCAMLLPTLTMGEKPVEAAAWDAATCISRSRGYGGIPSVQSACNVCAGGYYTKGMNIAAAWISSNPKGTDAIVSISKQRMTIDQVKALGWQKVGKIFGMSYSCGRNEAANTKINAWHVWFGKENVDWPRNNSTEYSFIRLSWGGDSFNRGVAPGGQYQWSSLGSAWIDINLNDFINNATLVKKEKVGDDDDDDVVKSTYELKVSVNRCFRNNYSSYTKPNIGSAGDGCGGQNSTIKLVITHKDEGDTCTKKTKKEKDKDCWCSFRPNNKECKPEEESVEGELSTTSQIYIAKQGEKYHDIIEHKLLSPVNGSAHVKLSTLEDKVEVEFEHKLNYTSITEAMIKKAIQDAEGTTDNPTIVWYGRVRDEDDKYPDPSTVTQATYNERQKATELYKIPVKICDRLIASSADDSSDGCEDKYKQFLYPKIGKMSKTSDPESDVKAEDQDDGTIKIVGGIDAPSGTVVPPDGASDADKEVTKVTIETKPGGKEQFCQKISAKPRTYKVTWIKNELKKSKTRTNSLGNTVYDGDGNAVIDWVSYDPAKYEYVITGMSDGSDSSSVFSKACAVIYRPKQPDFPQTDPGGDNPGPVSTTTADSSLMYAGESAGLRWEGKAQNMNTLRVKAIQTVMMSVPVDRDYSADIVKGSEYYKVKEGKERDVCTYYSASDKLKIPEKYSSAQAGGCVEVELEEKETEDKKAKDVDEYLGTLSASVPDNVGYKVCNAMGWRYEHWWAHVVKEEDEKGVPEAELPEENVTWAAQPDDDYWQVYSARCRSIAKKPSMSVWNGSMITQGGVKTGISNRSDNPGSAFGKELADAGTQRSYGSWTEYLAVVGGKYYGLGSGSSLWQAGLTGGSMQLKLCNKANLLTGNTPLTISNYQAPISGTGVGCYTLGYSGIGSDSIYRNRLKSFLLNNSSFSVTTTGNITSNITSSGGSLNGITQNVIYSPGDLVIDENVTQIDAWIYAGGRIITCNDSQWKDKDTEAEVRSESGGTYAGTNVSCTKQLVFNGPVIAEGGVELRRSYGSDALMPSTATPAVSANGRNRPGEVFNLRADAYLWAFAQGQKYSSSFTDSYSRELAPRY